MTGRRWAVVGVGGVGGLYAARLHAAGCEVHLVARSDAGALRADGLHLASPLGAVHARLPVHEEAATVPEVDVVALATKTTAPAARSVAAEIAARHPGAALLVLQNGLGVEAAVGAPPTTPVLGGMAFVCSQRVGPGRIEHLDFGPVSVGEHLPSGGAAGVTPAVAAAVADLDASGVGGVAVPDLVLGRWRKLVWNVPFNGLAVVLRARTDEMLADPAVTARVRALMDEVRAGAAGQGREIPAAFVDEMIATTRAMTPYAPSMRLDLDAGRPLELDAIYAAPLAAARAAGVDLPETAALLAELRALDPAARPA